jgi:hypothetical protein
MRYPEVLRIVAFVSLFISCRKDHSVNPPPSPPTETGKKILLKDIIIPHIPSPFYHFEYNKDSMVSKANFSDGFAVYDVLYTGNKIAEMRNIIIVNHDTLRYVYDNAGKLNMIRFINDENGLYRHVAFAYDGNRVNEINWDHKEANGGFLTDRTLTMAYYPEGNVKAIKEHRPAQNGSAEVNTIRQFEKYDDKINVDDFSIIHDGIHDHLFLLQGFRLQKNNPGKETFSAGAGLAAYTIDYSYTYNSDGTPSSRAGDFLYTAGSDAGLRTQISTTYTYY